MTFAQNWPKTAVSSSHSPFNWPILPQTQGYTSGRVHAYPDIFESKTFSFQVRLLSTLIPWIQHSNCILQLFESALQSGNFLIRYESGIMWMLNPDIFIWWRNKIEPGSLPWRLSSRRQPHSQHLSLTHRC